MKRAEKEERKEEGMWKTQGDRGEKRGDEERLEQGEGQGGGEVSAFFPILFHSLSIFPLSLNTPDFPVSSSSLPPRPPSFHSLFRFVA